MKIRRSRDMTILLTHPKVALKLIFYVRPAFGNTFGWVANNAIKNCCRWSGNALFLFLALWTTGALLQWLSFLPEFISFVIFGHISFSDGRSNLNGCCYFKNSSIFQEPFFAIVHLANATKSSYLRCSKRAKAAMRFCPIQGDLQIVNIAAANHEIQRSCQNV